uniref:Retrotransposon gag domain-containing protein n=1 Tax=Tanacetum cinerariifolium TaxID=118510 RepID=A0A6L2NKA0_TANCI|nr:hypothetical protein [Tanacetum cinerariifolium]
MRTRSSSNLPIESPPNPSTSNPKRRNRRHSKQPFILEESAVDTMAELLRAPNEGYAEAIVVPPILAEQFELKHNLINMMTSDQFFGLEKDTPHDHIRWFNKITSTIKYKDVPNSAIKLMLFPFSFAREAHRWLKKEPPHSILTWKDLVSKFINEFSPPSRTTNLRNEISNFQQRFDESFHEAWDRYKDLLRACPHHAILKQFQATPPPASVKAVEKIYVTCGGTHPYYQCLAAGGNTFPKLWDNIQGYVAAAVVNYNQGNFGYCPSGVANQIRPPGFAQPNVQNNQNHFGQPQGYNRGNNFNQEQPYQAPTQQNQVVPLTSMSNQTNELKNMMASFFQMNTASTSGLGSLPSNTIANLKGELKAITTRSGIVFDGPFVPIPPLFINPKEDKCVEETLTDQDLAEDPLHPNIPYPSRMHKQKQQEKDEVQIYKFWQMFKQLHINITLADDLIFIPKFQKMLKALLSNKEKLLELANTPLNENCLAVILKKLPEKLRDLGKFLIPCGFIELKCKALADLAEIVRDVFVPVGKFTFPANFVIVDYESYTRVPLILGRPFLRTARALIDVHREEMILRDGYERLNLNMRHDTSSYSNQPQKESINMINIYDDSNEDFLENLFTKNHQSGNLTFSSHPKLTLPKVKDDIFDLEGGNVLLEKLLDLDSTKDLHPFHHVSTTSSSSPNQLLKEFADELALIIFPPRNDDLQFDIDNLADLNDNLADTMPEMFTEEHALDYSSLSLYDEYDDDLFEVKSNTEYVYDDPLDSKGEKIKEFKLLIDELDLRCDSLPSFEYDSFLSEEFSKVDALPSSKTMRTRILIFLSTNFLSSKKFPGLRFYSHFHLEMRGKFFKPEIQTSKGVHSSLIPELYHQGNKVFKINQILKSPMKIFLFSRGEDIYILDVPCLQFYPP